MLNVRKLLARRISISHEHGRLLVRIARRNDSANYLWSLLVGTAIIVPACSTIIGGILRHQAGILFLSVFVVLFAVVYLVAFLVPLWRAFSEEEILVANGAMRWTHKALWWKHDSEIPAQEISEIAAITPWHGLSNHVEFTANGRRFKIGRRLLRDEANEIAHDLRRAVGLHLRPTNSGND